MANISTDLTRLKKFLIPVLRRSSYRWPARSEALKAGRIDRGVYKCVECGGSFKQKEIVLDHRVPVIPIETGFTTWDDFINGLFCEAENFQILCKTCNNAKTLIEREMRKVYRRKRKEEGLNDNDDN